LRNPLACSGLAGRAEADARLVVGGTAAGDQGQPRVGDLHDDRVAVQQHLPAEQRSVELPGTVLIGDNEHVGDDEALLRCRKVVEIHGLPPLGAKPGPVSAG